MALRKRSPAQPPREADEPVVVAEGITAEEYFRMPETTIPHNLIDGKLYMSPSPFRRHQALVLRLSRAVDDYATEHGGEAFVSPMDCKLPDGSVLQPDVGYISPERLDIFQDHVIGAPDVVIEVLSRGTRRFDRVKKLDVHQRNGVREAWLVDPDAETVTVFYGADQQWIREHSVLFGERIPSEVLDVGAAGLGDE